MTERETPRRWLVAAMVLVVVLGGLTAMLLTGVLYE